MPDILLTTLNARYAHAAFGLRYLLANLGDLRDRAAIVEFDINQRPIDVLEVILAQAPKIVGLGVYIWNVAPATIHHPERNERKFFIDIAFRKSLRNSTDKRKRGPKITPPLPVETTD